jgi:hypothetical protein
VFSQNGFICVKNGLDEVVEGVLVSRKVSLLTLFILLHKRSLSENVDSF